MEESPGIAIWLLLIAIVIFVLLLFAMVLVTLLGSVVQMVSLPGPIGCWAKVMVLLAVIITILALVVML